MVQLMTDSYRGKYSSGNGRLDYGQYNACFEAPNFYEKHNLISRPGPNIYKPGILPEHLVTGYRKTAFLPKIPSKSWDFR